MKHPELGPDQSDKLVATGEPSQIDRCDHDKSAPLGERPGDDLVCERPLALLACHAVCRNENAEIKPSLLHFPVEPGDFHARNWPRPVLALDEDEVGEKRYLREPRIMSDENVDLLGTPCREDVACND